MCPGNVALDGSGRNSPFTGALVRHLLSSNEEVMGLMADVRDVIRETNRRQVPWEHTAMTGRFYFKAPQEPRVVAPFAAEFELRRSTEAFTSPLIPTDFSGFVRTFDECEQRYRQSAKCNIFTFHPSTQACYLYSRADLKPNKDFDSGVRK